VFRRLKNTDPNQSNLCSNSSFFVSTKKRRKYLPKCC